MLCNSLQPHLLDRKSTRLNSSHGYTSYAVFCLKKICFLYALHSDAEATLSRPPGDRADKDSRQLRLFFNDTATTEIYTLSLHDALPISFAMASWWPISNRESGPRTCQSFRMRSEEHPSELQSRLHLGGRLLLADNI